MRRMLFGFAGALAVGWACPAAVPSVARTEGPSGAFTRAIAGAWRGGLEYRDYSNDKRVTLPTTLDARPADDGSSVVLRFRYDEGRGRSVEGIETLRVGDDGKTLSRESAGKKDRRDYAVAGLTEFAAEGRGAIVLTGDGVENDVKVDVRETIILEAETLTILKETRRPGDPFAFRNKYTLTRAAPAPAPARP